MEISESPRIITSRRSIKYRPSLWHVHEFEIWSGELVCKVVALKVDGGLFLWLGGISEPQLSEAAVGVPVPVGEDSGRVVLATALLGTEGAAVAMARRLGATLRRPVYVCCGGAFDRFTVPLVERGLIAEIKSKPECF